jgi:hypothetical protein
VLIKSVLSSLPIFLLSFFEMPKGVRKRLDFYRYPYVSQSDDSKNKYTLPKWNSICQPKGQKDLGIEVLDI